MEKQELQFEKRLIELSNQAFYRNHIVFTDFLNLNELNIFHLTSRKTALGNTEMFGGYQLAERQMAAFIPDALSLRGDIWPMEIIKISAINKKYSDRLTHRDYLGAILNLGIERSKIGDILAEENDAYVFCHQDMSEYLVQELYKVKHTQVRVERVEEKAFNYTPKYEELKGTVASVRLDSILSTAFRSSRSKLTAYISGGKVFVNGRLTQSKSQELEAGDIVSVRGLGKFMLQETGNVSRKGRIYVTINKYI